MLAIAVYVIRSGRQFSSPELWAEEVVLLNGIANKGVLTVLKPISGQFLPISTVPVAIGSVWLTYLPWLLSASALLTFAATSSLFAFGNSTLFPPATQRWIPLGLALIPIGPEVIGVGLYNFWWVGLWPVAVLTWRIESRKRHALGMVVVGAAALTSLAASLAAIVFIALGTGYRSRRMLLIGLAAIPGLLIQSVCAINGERVSESNHPLSASIADGLHMIGRFPWTRLQWFGQPKWPLVEPRRLTAMTGLALCLLIGVASFPVVKEKAQALRGLLSFLILYTGISIGARPGATLHPIVAGPRYFFLPWTVLILSLFALAFWSGFAVNVRFAAGLALFMGAMAWTVVFSRPVPSAPVNWRKSLQECATNPLPSSFLYAQEDGFQPLWKYEFRSEWCRANT